MVGPIPDQSELQSPIYLKELVLYRANYSQDSIVFEPLSIVATMSIHGQSSANPPSACCQSCVNPLPIPQWNVTWTISQPHIYRRQSSIQNNHRLTVHWQRIDNSHANWGKSENVCASNLGTSILYGPTEVSQRSTLGLIQSQEPFTILDQYANIRPNHDQSATNPMPIVNRCQDPSPTRQTNR